MTVNTTWTDPSEGGTSDLDVGDVLTEAVYDKILSNLLRTGGTVGDVAPLNLVKNGAFDIAHTTGTSAPTNWALVGTPSEFLRDTSQGIGWGDTAMKITTDAVEEGMSETITNLKPSTTYLVTWKAKATTGDTARVSTSGASTNLANTDTTATTYQDQSGTFTTDASATDVLVKAVGVASGDIVWFSHFMVGEGGEAIQFAPHPADGLWLVGSEHSEREVQCIVFDFATDIATGDGKFYFHVSDRLAGMDLADVHAEVITAGTTGTTDIQINNVTQAADMLTTKLTIDSAETGSDTAATAAVIDTANDDVAENDVLRIDVDAVSTTAPKGLIVTLGFRLP